MLIDINCDMGESFGNYSLGNDSEMMKYISSANIACGFHAGDPHVMRATVELAKKYDVAIGAHPGFPDLIGFGRRYMNFTTQEIKDYIVYQVGALNQFTKLNGIKLQHCKFHGALAMMAFKDENLARSILETIIEINEDLITFAPSGSTFTMLGPKMGIPVVSEVYADVEYDASGSVILRREGYGIKSPEYMAERALRLVTEGKVVTITGEEIQLKAESLGIHGDTPEAPKVAEAICKLFSENGIKVTNVKKVIGL